MKRTIICAALAAVLVAPAHAAPAIDCNEFAGKMLELAIARDYAAMLPSLAAAARAISKTIAERKVTGEQGGLYFRGVAHGYCIGVVDLTAEAEQAPKNRQPTIRSM